MKIEYTVVYERTPNNYCAYAPDVPGCVSTGETWDEIQEQIREALSFHIGSLIEQGDPIPESRTSITEAMVHHAQIADGADEPAPQLPTTVAVSEVEIPESLLTKAG